MFFNQTKKPILSVIKPDFEHWRPRDPENQLLMDKAHGFDHNKNEKRFKGEDNLAMSPTRF